MRKQLLLLTAALLCPVLAGAQSLYPAGDLRAHVWLGLGLGRGSVYSPDPAPASDLNAFSFSVDAGYRIDPQWGLGLEFGLLAAAWWLRRASLHARTT